jgi:hypothetical protein
MKPRWVSRLDGDLDTNGNGKRDSYVEPGQPADPAGDSVFAALRRHQPQPGGRPV